MAFELWQLDSWVIWTVGICHISLNSDSPNVLPVQKITVQMGEREVQKNYSPKVIAVETATVQMDIVQM